MIDPDWLSQPLSKDSNWHHQCWSTGGIELPTVNCQHLELALRESSHVFKDDRTTTVARWDAVGQPLILKRYNARSQWHKLKRAFRRSRARRCWLMSYHFQRAGLNVAPPVLMFEQRMGPWCGTAYFANLELGGEVLLDALPAMSAEQKEKVAAAVTDAFASMRRHKITHGDMKASNLIWLDEQLYFIDLDAATRHRSSLGWLRSTRRDRRRFLKNWRQYPDLLELFANLSDTSA